MTSYLISSGAMPFTGQELCAEFGIADDFAPALDALISSLACDSAKPVLASVWRISDDARFATSSLHGGNRPARISEPFPYRGAQYRDCTYFADRTAVALLRACVLDAAEHHEDINLSRAVSGALARARSMPAAEQVAA